MIDYTKLEDYSQRKLNEEIAELRHQLMCWYNICKYYHLFYPTSYLSIAGYDEALTKADHYCYLIVKCEEELAVRTQRYERSKRSQMNETLPPLQKTIQLVSVSEDVLLKAKAIEDKSNFFHSEDKGCTLKEEAIYSKWARRYIKIMHCYTHHIDCCHCGWEWGEHYDTHSKSLSNIMPGDFCSQHKEYQPQEFKLKCEVCGDEFIAHRKNALYCNGCGKIVRKEQTKRYRELHNPKTGGTNELVVSAH